MNSSQGGDLGSGAGKGGGSGGSIREAFGEMEAARAEEYFYKQQREQLAKLKKDLNGEISFKEEQIKRHQEAIQRQEDKVQGLQQAISDSTK